MDPYTKVTWAYAGFAGREGSNFFEFGRVVDYASKLGRSGACSTRNVCAIWGNLQYIF